MNETLHHKQLSAALGRIPSGMFILTARLGDAETGMLVSWVQQCSFDPLQISVALKQGRGVNDWLSVAAPFVVNILDASQTDMVAHFGKGFNLDEPAFVGLEIERVEGLPPILSEALGYLECRVVQRHPVGDHELLIAQVVGGKMLNEGQPMVHVRKSGLHY
jgi:flavin reductase (DIM6/NTAB) family NADH-FMN oxidoreductase RutF